ncbi:DUF3078 domain-containing protein [Porphyromonas sp. COT-239 OH1446]|uniref:DUF3078 domain-containing protein n=1 Tax=Porphyromonas sp. COT-239 OH1446 TaxID=1515613 RepID=UPI000689F09F|nr:DUF3078 domain-containing protein [Porphyromonas sp. COT-239 OH1446]
MSKLYHISLGAVSLGLFLSLSPRLWAQEQGSSNLEQALTRMNTLSHRYFTPRPIEDSLLIERMKEAGAPMAALSRFYLTSLRIPRPRVMDNVVQYLHLPLAFPPHEVRMADPLPSLVPDSLTMLWPKRAAGLYRPKPCVLLPDFDYSRRVRYALEQRLARESVLYFDRAAWAQAPSGTQQHALLTDAPKTINADDLRTEALTGRSANDFNAVDGGLEIRTRYWLPAFESTIQFSQNYMSENWYKGGASNLTLFMRTYGAMTYSKGKVQWKNELENKVSLYNSGGDSKHRYQVGEDLLRLQSVFALRAANRVYYALSGELRTQLWDTYKRNSDRLQTALLSPTTINVGLGVKFDYSKRYRSVYGRRINFSVNLSPFAYNMRTTINKQIDLARQGLSLDKLTIHNFGSTLRADMRWDINMNLSWSSRLYFNTTYGNVESEWENTLNMSFGRYFSTRVNLLVRFDDRVRPSNAWHRYFQLNELLSFGFNYRL